MSVSLRSSSNSGAGDVKTTAKPAGTAIGDTLIFIAEYYSDNANGVPTPPPVANTASAPTGFTLYTYQTNPFIDTGNTGHRESVSVFIRHVDGSEASTFTTTISDNGYTNCSCLCMTGADSTTPIVTSTVADFPPSGTSYTATWGSASVPAGGYAVAIFNGFTVPASLPAGYTAIVTAQDGVNDSSGQAFAGAGTATASATVATAFQNQNVGICLLLILEPPVAGGCAIPAAAVHYVTP